MLCQNCMNFVRWALENAKPLSDGYDEQETSSNLHDVVLAAEEGCYACNVSVNLAEDSFRATGYLDLVGSHRNTGLSLRKLASALLERDNSIFVTIRYTDETLTNPYKPFGLFEGYFQHFDTSMDEKFAGVRTIPDTNDHTEVQTQMRRWLSECLEDHAQCASNTETDYLPVRLIDTQPEAMPGTFLILETESMTTVSSYLTISHRWTDSTPRFTQENAATFQTPSPWTSLPITFQNAFTVVQSLGYRYLWIDSLCILQDDRLDMLKEGVMMMQVYSNAVCNISILNGRSDGIFCNRHPSHISTLANLESVSQPQDSPPKQLVLKDPTLWQREVDASPLSKRGWVLQEQILATRTLYFGQSQVLWECRCGRRCESYPKLIKISNLDESDSNFKLPSGQYDSDSRGNYLLDSIDHGAFAHLREILVVANDDTETLSDYSYDELVSVYGQWEEIISRYTRRTISFPQDKLLAIAGMAKALARAYQATWVAGLWEEFMPFGLLWDIDSLSFAGKRLQDHPTWSWASADARVTLADYGHYYEIPPLASVLKVECHTIGDDVFGPLSSAILTMKAPLVALSRRQISLDLALVLPNIAIFPTDVQPDQWPESRFRRRNHHETEVYISSDTNEEPIDPTGLKGALFYANIKWANHNDVELNLEGLILEPDLKSNQHAAMTRYNRVGRFTVYDLEISASSLLLWQPEMFHRALHMDREHDLKRYISVDFENATFVETFEIA